MRKLFKVGKRKKKFLSAILLIELARNQKVVKDSFMLKDEKQKKN